MQRCAASPEGDLPANVLEFDQMMEDLNNLPVQTPMLEEVPAAGEMCSAQYTRDDRWYRALVAKAFPTNSTALVFYVDYGNSEVVPLDRWVAFWVGYGSAEVVPLDRWVVFGVGYGNTKVVPLDKCVMFGVGYGN